MLGGGIFVTQNKTLPGSYINFINSATVTSTVSDRGTVAIALPLTDATVGTVVECTAYQFAMSRNDTLGEDVPETSLVALREIFKHANKAYIYNSAAEVTPTVATICNALEPYEFNVLAAYTDTTSDITEYITVVKNWRDTLGKKCQVVVYNATTPDHEGVINLVSTVSDEDAPAHALVAWLAGAEAGCAINASCTNMLYDGEYTIVVDKTQTQLEQCMKDGQIVFHLVYGDIRLLEDINSLVTATEDKGEDFKYNQTIRVIDQIANDIARLFNVKYLGKIPNNASGRVSLWADVVAHHRKLEEVQAIENFDATLVTVEQGVNKKSVVVNDVVKVVNALSQLYLTVVVQ